MPTFARAGLKAVPSHSYSPQRALHAVTEAYRWPAGDLKLATSRWPPIRRKEIPDSFLEQQFEF